MAFVTFIEEHRQVFRGRCAIGSLSDATESPISHSICQHVAAKAEPLIIDDGRSDPRVHLHPAVLELQVVAYAGVPIFDAESKAVGAMCAIDHVPRHWTAEDVNILQACAAQVNTDLSLRAAGRQLEQHFAALKNSEMERIKEIKADRHDLRTPLNALLMGVQAIREFGELNSDQLECIALVERNGEVLLSMIDRMLDIANIESRGATAIRRKILLPAELIENALEQVTALAKEKGLHLTTSIETSLGVAVDHDKILRVLVNLLGNAVKFTAPGGTISIHAHEDTILHGESGVRFSVMDTGIGISTEKLPLLFAEGYVIDSSAKTRRSTGLGLTFCKRVVEAHGSTLKVQSTEGKGSVFWFVLPASAQQ